MRYNKFIWISVPIMILQVVVASFGLFYKDLYSKNADILVSIIKGTDFFSLLIIIPALIICFMLIRFGSTKAFPIWLGTLATIIYNYIFVCFNVRFNVLFIAYTALLGLATYAVIGTAVTINPDELRYNVITRSVKIMSGIFQIVVGLLFYMLWFSKIIPAHFANDVTESMKDWNVITNAVYVIDIAFLLPLFIWGGMALLRQKTIGYLLSAMNLTIIGLMALSLTITNILMYYGGFEVRTGRLLIYVILCFISFPLLYKLLRNL